MGEKIIREQCQSLESKLGELRPLLMRVAVGVARTVFEENASKIERLLDVEQNYRYVPFDSHRVVFSVLCPVSTPCSTARKTLVPCSIRHQYHAVADVRTACGN